VASVQHSVLDTSTSAKHPRHCLFKRVFLQKRGAGSYFATAARMGVRQAIFFNPELPPQGYDQTRRFSIFSSFFRLRRHSEQMMIFFRMWAFARPAALLCNVAVRVIVNCTEIMYQ